MFLWRASIHWESTSMTRDSQGKYIVVVVVLILLQVCYRTLLHLFDGHWQHVHPPDKLLNQQGIQTFWTEYWSGKTTGQSKLHCILYFEIQGSKWTLTGLWKYLYERSRIERKPIWDQGFILNISPFSTFYFQLKTLWSEVYYQPRKPFNLSGKRWSLKKK